MNFNRLADVWEAQHGLFVPFPLGGATPSLDEDGTPPGDGTKGDGLSVYEEYRGVLWRGQWTELDPEEKDMFVINLGAGSQNPYVPPSIPNEAITSPNGFPGAEMPQLWLLNWNEGSGYPYRVVNFLSGSFHNRNVYAAIIVPGAIQVYSDGFYSHWLNDGQPDDMNGDGVIDHQDLISLLAYGSTSGPIWGDAGGPITPPRSWNYIPPVLGPPIIEMDVDLIRRDVNDQTENPNQFTELQILTWLIGHEIGHTVLWHRDDYGSNGHHANATTFDCLMWSRTDAWSRSLPTEFCANNPGCQTRWKLNP
jgi:hypothetical protein